MRTVLMSILIGICCAASLPAQSILGSMTGTVKDPSSRVIPGAQITVTNMQTGAERVATSNDQGDFIITNLEPATYRLTVRMSGFKTLVRESITLPASERLVLGDLLMQLGETAQSVTVREESPKVQIASAERSAVLSSAQVDSLLVRGRNIWSMLSLIPGLEETRDEDQPSQNFFVNALGGRTGSNDVSVDGTSTLVMNRPQASSVDVSMDSVAEVKVLVGVFQAEYGRASGANVQIVSKSGARQFHGLASYFLRNDYFNANNFFNNRLSRPRPQYRFNTATYNLSGPVIIPKTGFNKDRKKLFFFWSQEFWPATTSSLGTLTMPTALERQGDFSKSVDVNNTLIAVFDPLTGQAFPNNVVPSTRISKSGQALLNFFPQPNFTDRSVSLGQYNYVIEKYAQRNYRTQTLKLDLNASARDLFTVNITNRIDPRSGYFGQINYSQGWPQMNVDESTRGGAVSTRYNRIFSPTVVNEFAFGLSLRHMGMTSTPDHLRADQRDTIGFTAPQINPKANPLNLVPDATFGGITNPAQIAIDYRFPDDRTEPTIQFSDNVTDVRGPHTIKVGVFSDYLFGDESGYSYYRGRFNFGTATTNPLDTKHPYANALLGVYQTYQEDSALPRYGARMKRVEWFAQDTWKAKRRLTLDYGMRFQWLPFPTERSGFISGFSSQAWDRAKQPRLVEPALVNGVRMGRNPVTGTTYPAATIGALAPGTGDPLNGMVSPSTTAAFKGGLVNSPGVLFSPRFGFALDVFGNGKTAIRGGGGIMYTRPWGYDVVRSYVMQAPQVMSQTLYYSYLDAVAGGQGFTFPVQVVGMDPRAKTASVYNTTLAIQQSVGFGTILEAAYVGSLGRHLEWGRHLNEIPLGSNWNPAFIDPTNKATLPANFLRPIIGYANVGRTEWAGSSSYHSLQVQANRRFAQRVQYGMSWVWSKTMNSGSEEDAAGGINISALVPFRTWYHNPASIDRTHAVKGNWLAYLPKGSRLLGNFGPARWVLDNWQMSGIINFWSGQPKAISWSSTPVVDITGSASLNARVVVVGNPVLPKDQRTFSRNFRTDVFQKPAVGTLGNSSLYLVRGPGLNNWDIAIFKNFPIHESIRCQFRWEAYNAFNHTQFSTLDTAARFDSAGNQISASFGSFTAARNPRIMQVALRFYF